MNLIEQIQAAFNHYLKSTFNLDEKQISACTLELNIDEQKQQFGDLNSSAAMVLSKQLKRNPREIAEQITKEFTHDTLEKIEIAGPGFLNFFLTQKTINTLAQHLAEQKETFFKSENIKKHNISVEFVSANPTGPLHFGHGRGGIIGDVLGNILRFLGHNVTKEFYINDAGKQIQKLGKSLKIRCMQVAGKDAELPEDAYHGEYLIELAQQCLKEYGKAVLQKPDSFFADYAKKYMLEHIQHVLDMYGIHFDVWFSEKTLHDSGAIKSALDDLAQDGYLYEKDGALWFKSTEFGDDKDRVVRKASGELTYAAADIAYMRNKIERNHNEVILILGHDHHSYAVRLQGILQALGLGKHPLSVILYQLVKIKAEGELVRMSKRAGIMTTLEDIINTVGKDVARFFYLHRKADAQLEFDLDLALKHTEENPVYYVQYAYVRTKSILAKALDHNELHNIIAQDAQYLGPEEKLLVKKIISLKNLLINIGHNHQTHLLTYFIHELSQIFSRYYSQNRVIDFDNIQRSRARLLLIQLMNNTLDMVLTLLGISKPEKM
jgi:arginyl-tRNA synthetase